MRKPLLLAALLLLASLPMPGAEEKPEAVATPDRKALQGTPIQVDGEMVRFASGGILVQVRFLPESDRASYFRHRTRLGVDPFPPAEAYPEGFTVFEVSFLNGSKQDFEFSPVMASIGRGGGFDLFPFDIGTLYSYFIQVFRGDEKAVEQALEAVYTRTVYLRPGERTSQLLVFEALPRHMRRFTLELDAFHIGSTSQDLAVPFRVLRGSGRR